MGALQALASESAYLVVLIGAGLLAFGSYTVGVTGRNGADAGGLAGFRTSGWIAMAAAAILLGGPLLRTNMPAAPGEADPAEIVPGASEAVGAALMPPARLTRSAHRDGAVDAGAAPVVQVRSRRLSPQEAEKLRQGSALRAWAGPGAPRWIALMPAGGAEGTVSARLTVEDGGPVVAQVLDGVLRSLGTFAVDPSGTGSWSFRADGGDYFLVVSAAGEESRFLVWLD